MQTFRSIAAIVLLVSSAVAFAADARLVGTWLWTNPAGDKRYWILGNSSGQNVAEFGPQYPGFLLITDVTWTTNAANNSFTYNATNQKTTVGGPYFYDETISPPKSFTNPYTLSADSNSWTIEGITWTKTTANPLIGGSATALIATITTHAGTIGEFGSFDGVGRLARFNGPSGVYYALYDGNLYVADSGNHTIRRVTSGGVVTTTAGSAGQSGSADGTGSAARFKSPQGTTVDKNGNTIVADTGNHTIRKITPGGVVTTLAGAAGQSGSADGTGSAARFNQPNGVAVDGNGNTIVADTINHTIRKITPEGVVTTIAGLAGKSGFNDGTGSAARFNVPVGVASDAGGNIYVADTYNSTIRKITSGGVVTTFAGAAFHEGTADGTGSAAQFGRPVSVSVDATGNVYVGESVVNLLRKITSGGVVTTIAGAPGTPVSTDGVGTAAHFASALSGVTPDANGNLYVSEGATIRKVTFTDKNATPAAISTQPIAQSVVIGNTTTFSVVATGSPAPTYQWRKDGVNITGATSATLTITGASATNAGSYSVVVTNSGGTVVSSAALLTVSPANRVRIMNLSILTSLASRTDTFRMGFVVGGTGTAGAKRLVIRAAGPSLGALGVPGTLGDPTVTLFTGATQVATNDDWGGFASITSAMAAVGAFAYVSADSLDAALVADVNGRDNTVVVGAQVGGSASGAVIAEIYDATPNATFTATVPRLVNVSVLKDIGASLTAGFVIGGTGSMTVLIRAIGPGLAAFGVGGTVADPKLELFDGASKSIGANDDWGGTTALSAAFTSVGAFALQAASHDAALLATLQPGNYTVRVSGVNNATGVAIVEVYEVP